LVERDHKRARERERKGELLPVLPAGGPGPCQEVSEDETLMWVSVLLVHRSATRLRSCPVTRVG
jgi:hypothetical protein